MNITRPNTAIPYFTAKPIPELGSTKVPKLECIFESSIKKKCAWKPKLYDNLQLIARTISNQVAMNIFKLF